MDGNEDENCEPPPNTRQSRDHPTTHRFCCRLKSATPEIIEGKKKEICDETRGQAATAHSSASAQCTCVPGLSPPSRFCSCVCPTTSRRPATAPVGRRSGWPHCGFGARGPKPTGVAPRAPQAQPAPWYLTLRESSSSRKRGRHRRSTAPNDALFRPFRPFRPLLDIANRGSRQSIDMMAC